MKLKIEVDIDERDVGYLYTNHSVTRLVDNLLGSNGEEGICNGRVEVKEMSRLLETLLRAATDSYLAARCQEPRCSKLKDHKGRHGW